MTGEFNVCQFFEDGSCEYVRHNVDAKSAVEAAHHYCTSVAARTGITRRVIITDGDDNTNFVWEFDKGVTFK